MYSLELVITIALISLIAGIIGASIFARRNGSGPSKQQLEEQLSDLQSQQEDYQKEVAEHFVETAQLLNQLTANYRDVHNHLAKGAQKLAGDQAGSALEALPGTVSTATEALDDEQEIDPPLDHSLDTSDNTDDIPGDIADLREEAPEEKTNKEGNRPGDADPDDIHSEPQRF